MDNLKWHLRIGIYNSISGPKYFFLKYAFSGSNLWSFYYITHNYAHKYCVHTTYSFSRTFNNTAQPFTIPTSASYTYIPSYYITVPSQIPTPNKVYLLKPYLSILSSYPQSPSHTSPHSRSDFTNFNPITKLEFPKSEGMILKGRYYELNNTSNL